MKTRSEKFAYLMSAYLVSITAVSGAEVVRRLQRCLFQNKVMFPLNISAGMLISDDSLFISNQ